MKVIHCPKGGKVPQGYCMRYCLNYRKAHSKILKRRQKALQKIVTF